MTTHPMIARCGFQCSSCLAFAENQRGPEDRVRVAEGWKEYFGIDIPAEKIVCNGCLGPKVEGASLPEPGCPIRKCVEERGLETCADCREYPCAQAEARMQAVEKVAARCRSTIPAEEYARFIAPYEVRITVERIRNGRR